MPTYTNGELRDRPRINVLRGYPGNEPTSITAALGLDAAITNDAANTTIFSGQPILRTAGGDFTNGAGVATAWITGNATGAPTSPYSAQDVFFAYHDSSDTDVTSCGKLLGFSALGKFELETAWFDDDTSISVGDALGINAAGNLAKYDIRRADTPANQTGPVVGYCTGIRDLGVGGHVAGNERGGVLGTIPEDSTANDYTPSGGTPGNWVITFVTSIA